MNTETKTGQKGEGNKEGEGQKTESTGSNAQRGSITQGSDGRPKAEPGQHEGGVSGPSSGHE